MRRDGHEHPAWNWEQARRNVQILSEDGKAVGAPIAVGVFANFDAVKAVFVRILAQRVRIIEALGHPQPAAGVERHCDWLDDVGLCRE
jgi:hypothetical protein